MESGTGINRPLLTVIIGSGNVASAVGPALEKAGAIDVLQVYSPTAGHAAGLAAMLGHAEAVTDSSAVVSGADLYLVAVKDDAIAGVAATIGVRGGVWLHTSGGVECSELAPITDDYGVFYPLQTFTKGVAVDFGDVPVFVEGHTGRAVAVAERLGQCLSGKVYHADGRRRSQLHAAAVFACNFTNHLWAIADDVLRRETGTDLTVLRPLLEETMRKALSMRPAAGQTGPARRGDRGVIEHHKSLLKPDEAELYEIMSQHIIDYYERN